MDPNNAGIIFCPCHVHILDVLNFENFTVIIIAMVSLKVV